MIRVDTVSETRWEYESNQNEIFRLEIFFYLFFRRQTILDLRSIDWSDAIIKLIRTKILSILPLCCISISLHCTEAGRIG